MKNAIHPTYYPEAKVTCACGRSFSIGSTQEELLVELCSNCHPFYTGQQKMVDTAGRVDRFQKRTGAKKMTPIRSKRVKLADKSKKREIKLDESKKISKHRAA